MRISPAVTIIAIAMLASQLAYGQAARPRRRSAEQHAQ
jgi:hypothetical protein